MARGEIVYATSLLPAPTIHDRVARTIQSEAAESLLATLNVPPFTTSRSSKSHSRALVAAAIANTDVIALGIDVEWISPKRPFMAILRTFAPTLSGVVEQDGFYRAWTFLEAHYKAFQRWPQEDDIKQVLRRMPSDEPWQTSSGTQLLQHRVADLFELTLVWRCPSPCKIRRASGKPA